MPTKYESPLRAEQAHATAARILDAVRAVLERDPHNSLNFDALAAASGVNRRTIFRHFPTKEALLRAFWVRTNATLGVPVWPQNEADLTALPPALFASLDGIEGIVRAAHASATGREFRMQANEERLRAFGASLAEVSRDLDPKTARYLAALVQLLFSATAWLTMRDYWGLKGREAGEAAAWGIAALLAAARAERRRKPRAARA